MVEYCYDAWGNHKWTGDETLAKRNPFRYRGYYYDEETGLYFLKSRYYDPQIGRFINIDSLDYADPEAINGLNLYAYCNNNPVMNVDPDGHGWFSSFLKLFVAVALVVGLAVAAVATAGTAVGIVLAGAAIGGASGFISGGLTGAIGAVATGGNWFDGFTDGALSGTMIGGLRGAMNSFLPGGGSVLALSSVSSLIVSSAQSAAAFVGFNILFAKGSGRRFGHNQHENQMWDEAMRILDIRSKDKQQRLHRENRKKKYADNLKDLLRNLREIMQRLGM